MKTREIKFRAWDAKSKKMLCEGKTGEVGDVWNYLDNGFYRFEHNGEIVQEIVDPIIMQYTGLKDKNGKEIYEGDIVRKTMMGNTQSWSPNFHHEEYSKEHGVIEISKVVYREGRGIDGVYGGFKFDCIKRDLDKKIEGYSIEVIGNIYENPELLNG